MQRFLYLPILLPLILSATLSAQNPLYFPPIIGTSWETLDPESLGFCPDRIDSLYNFLETSNTKSFILLHDGRIVLEKYFGSFTQDSFWYWASAGKSVSAFLVGQALDEGLLNLSDPTSEYLGAGWTNCPPDKEALITIRHQLCMTNGLDDNLPPTPSVPEPDNCTDPACLVYLADAGTRWAYHNAPYHLIHDVLAAASGQSINLFTKNKLLDPTGMKGLWLDHVLYGRARDMARFGLLTLAKGVWNGDTLLHDQQYFYDMTHPSQDLNKAYGYLWWLNGQQSFMLPGFQLIIPGKIFPNAPDDLIAALGKNDQKVHVVPSKGWVIVRQGNASMQGPGGGTVPIVFDNQLWGYLNQLACNPSAVEQAFNPEIWLFPNPAAEYWTLNSTEPLIRIELYNAGGTLLRQDDPGQAMEYRLPAAHLAPGSYYARVVTSRGVFALRLIRQ